MKPLTDTLWHFVGFCLILGIPSAASAQVLGGPRPGTTAPRAYGFLTAFRSAIDVKHLNGIDIDPHFNWDADVSFDIDVVDAGLFRGNLFMNVETIVGSEIRNVDPNHNSYTADVSVFVRLPRGEISSTFHHVSRHFSDRATTDSISWNMFGVGYGDRFTLGRFKVDAGLRALWTVERAGVDYEAEYAGYASVVRPLNRRLALFWSVDGVTVQMDPHMLNRSDQRGGHVESGLRIATGVSAVDLFVAREQRIDPTSDRHELVSWTQFGIRVATPLP